MQLGQGQGQGLLMQLGQGLGLLMQLVQLEHVQGQGRSRPWQQLLMGKGGQEQQIVEGV
jgi:hypothetical protein